MSQKSRIFWRGGPPPWAGGPPPKKHSVEHLNQRYWGEVPQNFGQVCCFMGSNISRKKICQIFETITEFFSKNQCLRFKMVSNEKSLKNFDEITYKTPHTNWLLLPNRPFLTRENAWHQMRVRLIFRNICFQHFSIGVLLGSFSILKFFLSKTVISTYTVKLQKLYFSTSIKIHLNVQGSANLGQTCEFVLYSKSSIATPSKYTE